MFCNPKDMLLKVVGPAAARPVRKQAASRPNALESKF